MRIKTTFPWGGMVTGQGQPSGWSRAILRLSLLFFFVVFFVHWCNSLTASIWRYTSINVYLLLYTLYYLLYKFSFFPLNFTINMKELEQDHKPFQNEPLSPPPSPPPRSTTILYYIAICIFNYVDIDTVCKFRHRLWKYKGTPVVVVSFLTVGMKYL